MGRHASSAPSVEKKTRISTIWGITSKTLNFLGVSVTTVVIVKRPSRVKQPSANTFLGCAGMGKCDILFVHMSCQISGLLINIRHKSGKLLLGKTAAQTLNKFWRPTFAHQHLNKLDLYLPGHFGARAVFDQYMEKSMLEDGKWNYKCTQCGKQARDRTNMRNHIESTHFPGHFSYNCNYCEKTFTSKNALCTHVTRMHKK